MERKDIGSSNLIEAAELVDVWEGDSRSVSWIRNGKILRNEF
jgi:phage anti-repressor protein